MNFVSVLSGLSLTFTSDNGFLQDTVHRNFEAFGNKTKQVKEEINK